MSDVITRTYGDEVPDNTSLGMLGLKVFGKTEQFTTTGKNLLPFAVPGNSKTTGGVTVTYDEYGAIANGTVTDSYDGFAEADIILPHGKYYVGSGSAGILYPQVTLIYSDGTRSGYIIDNPFIVDETVVSVYVRFQLGDIAGTTLTNYRAYPMLVIGDKAPEDYEPYTGGEPSPNPEYPQPLVSPGDDGDIEVSVTGKNLLDYEKWKKTPVSFCSSFEYRDNGITMTATDKGDGYTSFWDESARIYCTPGIKYTMTWEHSGAYGRCFMFPNGELEGLVETLTSSKMLEYTPADDVEFFTFRVGVQEANATATYKNIRICIGDDTGFEPYKPAQTLTIPTPNGLPGIKVDSGGNYTDENGQQWITDEVDFLKGVYVKRIGQLNPYDAAINDWGGDTEVHDYYINVEKYDTNVIRNIPVVCNKFIVYSNERLDSIKYGTTGDGGWGGYSRLRFSVPTNINTVTLFKQYVGQDCIVYYQLKDHTEIPLSSDQLSAYASLRINKPTTVIMNDSGANMQLLRDAPKPKVFLHEQTQDITGLTEPNARLTVICPAGSTVTAVSGSTSYNKIADTTGKAVFSGLRHGTWTVTISNGRQTATQNVTVTTDYEVTIQFFTATIDITYPKGSKCTVTGDGQTFTAPDTTGKWECIVPKTGTWTVTATDGNESKTKEVTISSEGQRVEVTIQFFMATINVTYPPNALCTCSNGSTIYSASDTSGEWSFTVFKPGIWTVKATDGIQTMTENVNITQEQQVENVEFKFFAATISITYPAGGSCTITDDVNTFEAPDTSGKWTVTVPRTGTWKITVVREGKTTNAIVDITSDGQHASITLKFFASWIDVTYPSGTFKVVLWYIDSYGTKQEAAVDTSGNGKCRFVVDRTGSFEVGAYRVPPYVGIETTPGDYASGNTTISYDGQTATISLNYNTLPVFTYDDGKYKIVDDDGNTISQTNGNWNIQFLTSGVLRFEKLNGAKNGIDVFCVGGGGNGGRCGVESFDFGNYASGGGGGGGGYRELALNTKVEANVPYPITIGGAGGASTAFSVSASGGSNGGNGTGADHSGQEGQGGAGGSNGGKGGMTDQKPGENGVDGSRAFYNSTGARYGPGGGGGYGYNASHKKTGVGGLGGKDGGGDASKDAVANSGGGGGGESYNTSYTIAPGKGGSGIVIIRNKR